MDTVIYRVCVCIYTYTYIYISTHVWLSIYIYILLLSYCYDWLLWLIMMNWCQFQSWFMICLDGFRIEQLAKCQGHLISWQSMHVCRYLVWTCANMICPGYKWKDQGTSHLHSANIIKHAWHIYMAPDRNWFTSLAGCETCTAVRTNKTHKK